MGEPKRTPQTQDDILSIYGVKPPEPTPEVSDQDAILALYGATDSQETPETYVKGLVDKYDPIGIASTALEKTGRAYDYGTSASPRAAAMALIEGKGVVGALAEGFKQYAKNPESAPRGKDINKALGINLSEKPASESFPALFAPPSNELGAPKAYLSKGGMFDVSPAGLGGGVTEAVLDVSNLVPIGKAAKVTYWAGKTAGKRLTLGLGELGGKIPAAMAKGVTATGGAIEGRIKRWGNALNPRLSENISEHLATAEKFGIPKEALSESILYGEHSPIATLSRIRAQGVNAQDLLAKHNNGLNTIRSAFDSFVTEKIGKGASPVNTETAGEVIREGWDRAVSNFFDNQKVSYATVLNDVPNAGLTRNSKDNLLEKLGQIVKENTQRGAPGRSDELAGQIRKVNERATWLADVAEHGTYEDFITEMRKVGEDSFQWSKQRVNEAIPQDIKRNQQMYFAMRDAIYDTVKTVVGDDKAAELKKANEAFTEFFQKNSFIQKELLNDKLGGEKVFQSLIASGDSKKIEALRQILGDDSPELALAKASWIENLKTVDKDNGFSFTMLGNQLRNNSKAEIVRNNLFKPEELRDLDEILNLGVQYGPAIENFSRSGQFLKWSNIPEAIKSDVAESGLVEYMKRVAGKNSARDAKIQGIGDYTINFAPGASVTVPSKVNQFLYKQIPTLDSVRTQVLKQGPKEYAIQQYSDSDAMKRRLERKKIKEKQGK